MTSLADLQGQVAVISGAGSGIGAGLAGFAATRLGMTVVVVDRDVSRAREVATGLRAKGAEAVEMAMDVGDWTSVQRGADEVLMRWGAPAFLACNAGIEHTGLAWQTAPADWERVQQVNVMGAFHLMRAFVPAMLERDAPGQVLFTSSLGGISIGPSQSAYLVSKHAVRVLGQTLRADLESIGSRLEVAVLLPGAVQTRIFQDALTTEDQQASEYRSHLADHLATEGISPDEVAAVTFAGIDTGRRWIYPHPAQARQYLELHTSELLDSVESDLTPPGLI